MKLAIFPLLSSFLCCLLFGYAFLLLPPVLLAPSRIENFKVHQKDDMTAVVIPRENWMLLFFFSATLEKNVAFSSDAMLGMLLKRQQKIHPSCGFDMSSTRWFFCLEYIPSFHILLVVFLLQCITNWIWSRQCEKSVWLQEKIQSLWKSPLSPHLLSSCSARTQKH